MSTPSPAADRNLLFGLLALQMDFITRDQLIEAMNAWMIAKHEPLGGILVRHGILTADERDDLDKLVSRHIERHGDAQASLAAIPIDLDMRRSLAGIDDHDIQTSLGHPHPTTGSMDSTSPHQARSSASSMRYQRLRDHARGGLGEVFVALDTELGREVALKEIQERFADDSNSRARFMREAEVTGMLEHPGVVPVYGLGSYPDGRPYYAMRFILGNSMRESIERFHKEDDQPRHPGDRALSLRDLLMRFVAVCDAMAYAHSRGVIHRDLKPANVMLGQYGETLIVDWGLARLVDQIDDEQTTADRPIRVAHGKDSVPTIMGKAVGTPAYMPPEQALGQHDRVSIASDVFALGAILHDVLTGHPPYQGENVLAQAQRGDVPPARQIEPGVPRALEAICIRAMAKEPEKRYPSARAVGDEVRRWLADEPVEAYRESAPERMRRWGRRNRSVVTSGVVLLLAAVLGLGIGLWAVNREKTRTEQALVRALDAETEAQANLELAQDNLKLAKQAIDECYNTAREHPLFQHPRMEKARRLLLEKTLPFYKNFRVQRPDDPELQHAEVMQWFRVTTIETILGRTREALLACEQARRLGEKLVKDHPDESSYQNTLAETMNNQGLLLSELGRRSEALEECNQAVRLGEKLAKARPDVAEYQNTLADAINNRAILLAAMGQRDKAFEDYAELGRLRRQLMAKYPNTPSYQNALASMHNNVGMLFFEQGKHQRAQKEWTQGLALRLKLAKAYPDAPMYHNFLGGTHNNLGTVFVDLGNRDKAMRHFTEARRVRKYLIDVHPDVPRYKIDLITTHHNLGNLLRDIGKGQAAIEELTQAAVLSEELVKAHPDVPDHKLNWMKSRHYLGETLVVLGKRDQALVEFTQAQVLAKDLMKAYPSVTEYQKALAATHHQLGLLFRLLDRREEAIGAHREARRIRRELAKAHPEMPADRKGLADACNNLGILMAEQGKREKALEEYTEARRLRQALVKAYPEVPRYQSALADVHNNLGVLLRDMGKRLAAIEEHTQALRIRQALVKAHPDLHDYQNELARSHNNLGIVLRDLGKRDESVGEFTKARDLRVKLVKAQPNVPEYQKGLGDGHHNLVPNPD